MAKAGGEFSVEELDKDVVKKCAAFASCSIVP